MRAATRAPSHTLVVHACWSDSDRPARAGLVVGRSVGPAVVRNRVARQLRHLLAPRLPALPAGTDLVVRALPSAAGASSADLARDLDSGVRRVRSRLGHAPGTRTGASL